MIIQGPMGIVADRASGTKEAIWMSVETGQLADIAKGSLCAWDFTDYSATAGILQNTRGIRVVIYPVADAGNATTGVIKKAGFAHKLITGNAAFATTRGPIVLIQVYGFRSDLTADTDGASNIVAGGLLVPSGDAAGAVEGPQDVAVPDANEVSKSVGVGCVAVAINTTVTATYEAIVNTLS